MDSGVVLVSSAPYEGSKGMRGNGWSQTRLARALVNTLMIASLSTCIYRGTARIIQFERERKRVIWQMRDRAVCVSVLRPPYLGQASGMQTSPRDDRDAAEVKQNPQKSKPGRHSLCVFAFTDSI